MPVDDETDLTRYPLSGRYWGEHYHAVAEIIGYVMGLKRGVFSHRA